MKRVRLYYRTYNGAIPWDEKPQIEAAYWGFRRHGLSVETVDCGSPPVKPGDHLKPCDLAVSFGVKHFVNELATGKRAAVLEFGYVGPRMPPEYEIPRRCWVAFGFDSWGGRADFRNRNSPSDRWNKHFSNVLQPWRGHAGHYVLILGQVLDDADLAGINTIKKYKSWAKELWDLGYKVAFRPHPLTPSRDNTADIMANYGARLLHHSMGNYVSFDDALESAKFTVSWNSNAATDSVLRGIPAVTFHPGGMAFPMTGHSLRTPPPMPEREQWAYDLAYTQWNLWEIWTGQAWDHLRPGMDGIW